MDGTAVGTAVGAGRVVGTIRTLFLAATFCVPAVELAALTLPPDAEWELGAELEAPVETLATSEGAELVELPVWNMIMAAEAPGITATADMTMEGRILYSLSSFMNRYSLVDGSLTSLWAVRPAQRT